MTEHNDHWGLSIKDLLLNLGEDLDREGLQGTPKRVERAWNELLEGYTLNSDELFESTFEAEGNGMQLCKNIAFTSMCEHHLLPFYGYVHICYNPSEYVIGLSKLSRLVDCFAHRLQIQERMTQQLVDTIATKLSPMGVFVLIEAVHLCCKGRGIRRDRMVFTTSGTYGTIDSTFCAALLENREKP